ncbi:sensor histidine kinase [Streptomyces boncukensis]|uniref:histidine kinase n=1 Tax=Streptomyces boncukensis TaxID=2711219 RepID=A0A6G4WZQ4_9ACTN|nr:histidine kinase [Streptomyces boncukensis]NGO70087.1 two-component sensor histidine kinase [Streptomyces boncukensis]
MRAAQRERRTSREWAADIGAFLFASCFLLLTADEAMVGTDMSENALFLEQLAGAAACAALFLRRRWPVPLAVVLLLLGPFGHFFTGACLVALFTAVSRREPRVTKGLAVLALAPIVLVAAERPAADDPKTTSALVYFTLLACAIGWGLFVRSQRLLVVASMQERAESAATQARREAREDIAREMHDVLAHRLSLLSVHAGALEVNPGGEAEQVRRAAGVIRESAHQALEDLREIIGVLRSPEDAGRPQPQLADLRRLVGESRDGGLDVTVCEDATAAGTPPALAGRTAYRVVQEGLTNVRKHAPDSPVTVTVRGAAGEGLSVELRNPAPAGSASAGVPGAGQGLIGLAERASLAGGHLEHGWEGRDFRLYAWLPWPVSGAGAGAAPGAVPGSAPGSGG